MSVAHGQAYLQRGRIRTPVGSLAPFLADSLATDYRMDPARMDETDRAGCAWLGFGIGKGVTHPAARLSVFAVPDADASGLHGGLVQGFAGLPVDPTPACYEPGADPGFGGFIRWVAFADPERRRDVLGIDFSLALSDRSGVAPTVLAIAETVSTLLAHGLPRTMGVAFLNTRMVEPPELGDWRRTEGLETAADWAAMLPRLLPEGGRCPRCGQPTLSSPARRLFCYRCGCQPALVWASRRR